MIGRRQALGLLAAAPAMLGRAAAQSARRPRNVVVLAPNREQLPRFHLFEAAMRERSQGDLGALDLAVRFAADHPGGVPGMVAATLAVRPDVVVAANTPIAKAALAAGGTTPIVMAVVGDRAEVAGTAGAQATNLTGVTTLVGAMAAKRLALLKEAAPAIRHVLALHHPDDPVINPQMRDLAPAARELGVTLRMVPVREPVELDAIFADAAAWGADAVFRLAGQAARTRARTIDLCRERRLPSMLVLPDDVQAGGLMSYYASFAEHWERVASLVERVLKGAAPRDLPIEQPTRFDLVLNLATARAIGLQLSPAFVARADEVIE